MYKLSGQVAGFFLKAYARRSGRSGDPAEMQTRQLLKMVDRAQGTRFGIDHDFAGIQTVADYQERVPLRTFADFWDDYWADPFPVLRDVTWPGAIRYFAKTSGTSTGQSKHIPCSDEMIKSNNAAGLQVVLHHLRNNPKSTLTQGRTFLFGGSPNLEELAPGVFTGELSGIAARETPSWAGRDRYYPPPELAALTDWNEKLDQLAEDCVGKDIRSISGVPTWLQVLFDRAFDVSGIADRRLVTLFPDLELITHGGINFEPYERQFQSMLAGSRAELREVYAASEGFMAVADREYREGMRLLLDNGLFFEFVEVDQLDQPDPKRCWIADVEPDKNYAVVLTTCAGLWAYSIGDIVRLVDIETPRLLVAGRVSQTLSAFGEHLTGEELEVAVTAATSSVSAVVNDFSVAPVFSTGPGAVGHHRFVIETTAIDETQLAAAIDASLVSQNADYQSKRTNDIAIAFPEVTVVPAGTFEAWMATQGRVGGQNKVPRVTNVERLDDIINQAR